MTKFFNNRIKFFNNRVGYHLFRFKEIVMQKKFYSTKEAAELMNFTGFLSGD